LINAVASLQVHSFDENERKGFAIVTKACSAPFQTILTNCGIEDHYSILRSIQDAEVEYLASTQEQGELFTFDAKAQKVVHAVEAGLLDPTKVTRTALENAASVAGTILTTESVIFEKKDEKSNEDDTMQQF
jgi:chaperonin GroEL